MYYIVYLLVPKVTVVIPENWIRWVNVHMEKFLNYGVNSNQTYICYWTDSENARDINGAILLNFLPDFSLNMCDSFPSQGLYLCKIIKAKGKLVLYNYLFFALNLRLDLRTPS